MTSAHEPLGWTAGFTIPPYPTGAVLAVDFGRFGTWAGRLDGTKRVTAQVLEPRIVPTVLDLRVATGMVDDDSVPEAADPEVFDELVALVGRARTSMGDRDSSLAMGPRPPKFVSVSRVGLVESTVPEVNRLHGMLNELAGPDPIDAILLGPGTRAWPGLWEALTERGFSTLLPGDPFPPTFGGDDETDTGLLEHLEQPPAVTLAWERSDPTDGPVSFSASGVDPAEYAIDDNGDVRFDSPADPDPGEFDPDDVDEDGLTAVERELQARRRRRWTAVAAVAVLLGLAGAGTAVAMNLDEHGGPTMTAVDDSVATESTTPSPTATHLPTSADAREVAAARATMLSYTTPPPPPKATERESTRKKNTQKPTTGAKPRPRKHRRTIPNPIPGLPPIVIG